MKQIKISNRINSFCEKNNFLKWIFLFLFVLTIGIHFYLSLEDSIKSSQTSSSVTEEIVEVIEDVTNTEINQETAHIVVRKLVGHFMWFGLIGLFGFLTFTFFLYKKSLLSVLLCTIIGALIAIVSELLQTIPSGRSCEIKDMLIDFSGYLLMVIILLIILFFINKHCSRKENANIKC